MKESHTLPEPNSACVYFVAAVQGMNSTFWELKTFFETELLLFFKF